MSSSQLANALWSCAVRCSQHGRHSALASRWGLMMKGLESRPAQNRGFASLPSHTVLAMPALSPTMSRGNLSKWHVTVGEQVAPGSVLADIETDKATLAFENQDDGYVAKLLVQEGSMNIAVGTPVAVLVEDAESIAAFANYSSPKPEAAHHAHRAQPMTVPPLPMPTPAPCHAHAAHHRHASSSEPGLPPHTKLAMPSLSPTMDRGNILQWTVKEGDALRPGDVMAEIETDKAVLAFENQEEGYLARLLVPAGTRDVLVGTTVAIIVEERDMIPAFASYSVGHTASAAAPAAAATPPAPPPAAPAVVANHRMGPAARMLLAESGLSPGQVTPTGPNHIITKADVMAAIAAGAKPAAAAAAAKAAAAPAAPPKPAAPKAAAVAPPPPPPAAKPAAAAAPPAGASFTDTPNSQIRKVIASRLLESKVTIPAMYLAVDAQLDDAVRFRKMLQEQGVKISLNDIVLKAIAAALAQVPEANSYWDVSAQEAKRFSSVDVCVAVATERGLITPIVKAADRKSLQQISQEVRELATRARENKLRPEEFQGGSFTVSNLGMMGVAQFCAIINPPQAAILAVGGSQQRPVLDGDKPSAETYMTVTLSADHRVYDGELASRLLQAFKEQVERPSRLLL